MVAIVGNLSSIDKTPCLAASNATRRISMLRFMSDGSCQAAQNTSKRLAHSVSGMLFIQAIGESGSSKAPPRLGRH